MKEMSKVHKIITILAIVIIIAGIIVLASKGFNKAIEYEKSKKIEVNIEKDYQKEDIKQIASEVFEQKDIQIQDIEKTNQVVSIRIKDYTEDELNNLKAKISEKYEIEEEKLTVTEIDVPATKITTLVLPYVFPVSLVTVLSIIYTAIRNIKKDASKKIAKLITCLILVAGLYFSIIVLMQLPFNVYVMPIALTLYVATLLITVGKLNKE